MSYISEVGSCHINLLYCIVPCIKIQNDLRRVSQEQKILWVNNSWINRNVIEAQKERDLADEGISSQVTLTAAQGIK